MVAVSASFVGHLEVLARNLAEWFDEPEDVVAAALAAAMLGDAPPIAAYS